MSGACFPSVPEIMLPASITVNGVGAVSSLLIERIGNLSIGQGAIYTPVPGCWASMQPTPTVGDAYEVRLLLTSGSFVGTPTDVWFQLNITREYICSGSPLTSTGILQFRRFGGTTILIQMPLTCINP